MKCQYLGDSKDSFKWDYHDYLVSELGYPALNVVLMMTPDDGGKQGETRPELFPARRQIVTFCHELRASRDINGIKCLPGSTGASYDVSLHKNGSYLTNKTREQYFSGFECSQDQIIFFDPDNGFEPQKSCTEKHIRYKDVTGALKSSSENSIATVFQHFRRVPFPVDFARIQCRLEVAYSTAIYWHSLMFVAIANNEPTIRRVCEANAKYARSNPVSVLACAADKLQHRWG